jgi:hypothetical protein
LIKKLNGIAPLFPKKTSDAALPAIKPEPP